MGEWHDSLEAIDPDARPNRDVEPLPGTGRRRRRKVAVARRSRAKVAPGGGYYYWCEHCDYCNTIEEGRAARCPDHVRAFDANRKARQRRPAPARTATGDYILTGDQLLRLHQRARSLNSAARAHDIAVRTRPGDAAAKKRDLDSAVRDLLTAVGELPKPQHRT